jgi:hypothetical protein
MNAVDTITLIGIDCACQPENIGIARGEWHDGQTTVSDVLCGKGLPSVAKHVAGWVQASGHCLLALDAPLGWPSAMGDALHTHVAGGHIATSPDLIFRRDTDRNIKTRLGKTPLDVGADRIARTAHAALSLLYDVRRITGLPIPLIWESGEMTTPGAIEVYPAGTLLAHGMPASGYKKPTQRPVRAEMIARLANVLTLPDDHEPMLNDADCLDAVLCILSAVDFLAGAAVPPTDVKTAKKEGWIWVCELLE